MLTFTPPILIRIALIFAALSQQAVGEPLEVKEVAPGLFVHQGVHQTPDSRNHGEIANIGFVIGAQCVAVIDSGATPDEGQRLLEAIRKETRRPICYVINTHVHPDHIYGNIAFKNEGARFVGHRKLAGAMADRAAYYSARAERDLGVTLTDDTLIPPDLPVDNELYIELGDRSLKLTAHPTAHTDNDLSIFDLKTKTLWLGDLLFMGHLPVIDGSLLGWLKEIEKLRSIKADRVIPGHGPILASWPLALTSEENYLKELASKVRESLQKNFTIERAMAEITTQSPGDWLLYEDFHKKNIATAFAELEWEEDPQPSTAGITP